MNVHQVTLNLTLSDDDGTMTDHEWVLEVPSDVEHAYWATVDAMVERASIVVEALVKSLPKLGDGPPKVSTMADMHQATIDARRHGHTFRPDGRCDCGMLLFDAATRPCPQTPVTP